MKIFATYFRALSMLGSERLLALILGVANVAIAALQLAEPILFGRVIDALAQGRGAFHDIGLWAALGLFGIGASVLVAVIADRFAHRLSTVRDADRILVLDRGRTVEAGRFDELARGGSLFKRLVTEGGLAQAAEAEAE